MGKLSVKNSDALNSKSVVLTQPSKSTSLSVFKWNLMIFHQSIRGISNKIDGFVNTIVTNPPHVLCFTEQHLKTYQLDNILLQTYKLGDNFCRKIYRNGGVCIYIHELFQFSNINVYNFCNEKDLEACLIKLYLPHCTIGIVNVYGSPTGNFEHFPNNLETLLNSISSNSMELIICRDFNINFLNNTTHKQLLNSLLATYGLYSTVQLPTRICNNSVSTVGNIFINKVK